MDSSLISIIIPIYNVDKYLDECLHNVINQTYKNLEILLINDGSTDNSYEIAKKYSKIDNRVKLFNQKNQGLSSARNVGLDNMHGDYLTFIDSDDSVSVDMIENLYNDLIKESADISIIGTGVINEKSEIIKEDLTKKDLILDNFEALNCVLNEYPFSGEVWGKLYKSSLFKNIRFNPNTKVGEDIEILYLILYNSNKIIYNPKTLYYFRVNSSSITKTIDIDVWKTEIELCEKIISFCNENMPICRDMAIKRYIRINISILKKIFKKEGISKDFIDVKNKLYKYKMKNIKIIGYKRLFVYYILKII